MAGGVDPLGSEKYWDQGLPFEGMNNPSHDPGTEKYWFNGLPGDFIFGSGAQSPLGQPFSLRERQRYRASLGVNYGGI